MTAHDIAVVVCSRDRPELLSGVIPALVAAQRDGAEVVVVDSASRGAETRELADRAGLHVVRCDLPGASRARNAGLHATSASVVVFTDDDCRPHPGWQQSLATAFTDSDVGFATGRVLPGSGAGRAMSPMTGEQPQHWAGADDVGLMGHGANMAFRRRALESIGGFDEVLGAGAPLRGSEDKDVFWRLLRAGWHGRFVPESVVEHAAWRGHRESLKTGFGYGIGIGARTAKVARLAGERSGRPVARQSVASLRQVGRTVRAGHRFGAANLTLRAAGILVGGVRARRYDLTDGRFVPRDR
jgi:cellulose synthase/poly-beta-1,6-N-acetylglucosamine synthase-like glycosyltransferase